MIRCCAEIGKPGAWRQCRRRARWRVWRSVVPGGLYCLDYCGRHRKRTLTKPTCAVQYGEASAL